MSIINLRWQRLPPEKHNCETCHIRPAKFLAHLTTDTNYPHWLCGVCVDAYKKAGKLQMALGLF